MINHNLLAYAIEFYGYKGFKEVEVPWIVTEEACDITCPKFAQNIYVSNMPLVRLKYSHPCVVASGEQGFLQRILDGDIEDGMYQTTTACFRAESRYDEFYKPNFMKTELILIDHKDLDLKYYMDHFIRICSEFYKLIGIDVKLEEISENQIDIIDSIYGIELGSYGIRSHKDFRWVYGTGLALPRASAVIQKQHDYKIKLAMVTPSLPIIVKE